ncbi:MAG: hypothetical protein U0790_24115 [Isosphaeraceae bacterium]
MHRRPGEAARRRLEGNRRSRREVYEQVKDLESQKEGQPDLPAGMPKPGEYAAKFVALA